KTALLRSPAPTSRPSETASLPTSSNACNSPTSGRTSAAPGTTPWTSPPSSPSPRRSKSKRNSLRPKPSTGALVFQGAVKQKVDGGIDQSVRFGEAEVAVRNDKGDEAMARSPNALGENRDVFYAGQLGIDYVGNRLLEPRETKHAERNFFRRN